MTNRHFLFIQVQDYYADLVTRLQTADQMISMTCLAFEDGQWGGRIADALSERAAAGVKVRLMVDELGQLTDEPRSIMSNYKILNELRSSGVQVDVFRPTKQGLSIRNRMHCKFVAVDDETAYLGGSNVGDYYTTWSDTNLRVDGNLGDTLHRTYDYLHSFSEDGDKVATQLNLSDLWLGDDRLLLTVPGSRFDIRDALLEIFRNARRSIYLRTWYFLPDNEMLKVLCSQAEKNVKVHALLSHRTRVRPVDLANAIHVHRLTCAGGRVYRYTDSYMHAKTTWNDQGTILLGSANLDPHSMAVNFESCLQIQDANLARQLQRAFQADLQKCTQQTPESYRQQTLPDKFMTHACNLASPWL